MSIYFQKFRAGDTWRIRIRYPVATDLTGYRFCWTIKSGIDDPDEAAILQIWTTAGDDPADDPTVDSFVYLTALPAQTRVAPGRYFWDIQVVTPDGNINTIAPPPAHYTDKLVVVQDITLDEAPP